MVFIKTPPNIYDFSQKRSMMSLSPTLRIKSRYTLLSIQDDLGTDSTSENEQVFLIKVRLKHRFSHHKHIIIRRRFLKRVKFPGNYRFSEQNNKNNLLFVRISYEAQLCRTLTVVNKIHRANSKKDCKTNIVETFQNLSLRIKFTNYIQSNRQIAQSTAIDVDK